MKGRYNNMRKMSEQKKKSISRVIVLVVAIAMLLGVIILPLAQVASAEDGSVVVDSFTTGKLSEAIEEAKDGLDLNYVYSITVKSGELNSDDYQALCGYPNVETLDLSGCTTSNGVIPSYAIASRNQLSYISLPSNTTEIAEGAFNNNKKLTTIAVSSTIKTVGAYAFDSCEALESFDISTITSLGEGAFKDCKALTSVVISDSITDIPAYCFQKCGITTLTLGTNVKSIGEGAFSDCYNLTDVYYYGTDLISLSDSSFQNAKLSFHVSEELEDFDSLNNNFVTVSYDMDDSYTYEPTSDTAIETTADSKATDSTEKEDDTAAITKSEDDKAEDSDEDEDTDNSNKTVDTATDSTEIVDTNSTQASSTGLSVGVVVIIVILAVALAVVATILVMTLKKKKSE